MLNCLRLADCPVTRAYQQPCKINIYSLQVVSKPHVGYKAISFRFINLKYFSKFSSMFLLLNPEVCQMHDTYSISVNKRK